MPRAWTSIVWYRSASFVTCCAPHLASSRTIRQVCATTTPRTSINRSRDKYYIYTKASYISLKKYITSYYSKIASK